MSDSSINSILNTARHSLMTHKDAVGTTSKNISNINTPGYTRRRADFSSMRDVSGGFASLSGAMSTEDVERLKNSFIEKQLVNQKSMQSKYDTDVTLMGQIEDIFGEPEKSGLANTLREFWNSWRELSRNPESKTARTMVKNKGQILTQSFNRINSDLISQKEDIEKQMAEKVKQVNDKIEKLRNINEKVIANRSPDLFDERDQLARDISEIIDVSIQENENGALKVVSDGQLLLSDNVSRKLKVNYSGTGKGSGEATLKIKNSELTVRPKAGELGSMMNIYNKKLPSYIEKLNTLATNIAEEVNNIHSKGYNIEDKTGLSFFKENVTSASNFGMSERIERNPSLIASASKPAQAGNGKIAQKLADLQNKEFISEEFTPVSPQQYYDSLITGIGSEVQQAEGLSSSQSKIVDNITNQREEVSGVSLDEEMMNLSQYQQGYQGAARVVTVVNDMVDAVLGLVR